MGDFNRALYDMTTAIQIDQDNNVSKRDQVDNLNVCCILYFELGLLDDAAYYADQATRNDPSNGRSFYNRGLI